jgi:fructokinase
VLRRRVPSASGDYAATVRTVAALVRSVERELALAGPAPTGICGPGSLSPVTGLLRNANSVWLNGKPLLEDLQEALERPVRYANDADCLALSEAYDGAAQDADSVFAVILGTGVGGGIVIGGHLIQGANGIAGEWGHTPMPACVRGGLLPCWCGKRGCIECYLSGPALEREYRLAGGAAGLRVPEITAQAAAGDAIAARVLNGYERRLGAALATVINVLDPEVVVLGGGLSNLDRLYRHVPALWRPHVFADAVHTALRRAAFGDSSGVRGSAWLWPP